MVSDGGSTTSDDGSEAAVEAITNVEIDIDRDFLPNYLISVAKPLQALDEDDVLEEEGEKGLWE